MAREPDGELSTPEKRPAPRSGVASTQRRRPRAPGCGKASANLQACVDVPRAKRQRSGRCKAVVDPSVCEAPQPQPQAPPARRRSSGPGRPPAHTQRPRTKASHIALSTQFEECQASAGSDTGLLQLAEPGDGHTIVQLTGQLPGKEDRIASWMQVYSSAGRSSHHGQPAYASQDENFLLYYSSEPSTKGWWLGHMVDGTTSSAALAFLPHGKHRWWVLEEGGTPCEAQVIITAVPPPQIPEQVAEEPHPRQALYRQAQQQEQQAAKPPKPKNFQPGAFWTYFGGKGVSLWHQQAQNQPSDQSTEVCNDSHAADAKRPATASNEAKTSTSANTRSPPLPLTYHGKEHAETLPAQEKSRSSSTRMQSHTVSTNKSAHSYKAQQPMRTLPQGGHSEPGTSPMTQDQIAEKIAQMEAKLPRKSSPSVAWRPPRRNVSAKEIGLVLAPQVLTHAETSFLSEADAAQQDLLLRSLAKYTMLEPVTKMLEPTKRNDRRSSHSQQSRTKTDLRNLTPDMRIAIGAH